MNHLNARSTRVMLCLLALAVASLAGCQPVQPLEPIEIDPQLNRTAPIHASAGPSAAESNLAVATQYFTNLWSNGDLDGSRAIIADGFHHVDRSNPAHPLGKAGTLFLADHLRRGFSNVAYVIDAAVVDGDTVAVAWRASGTHDGTYGFLPATNKTLSWTGMSFLTINDGQVVHVTTNAENLSALLGDGGTLRISPSYAQ